MNEIDLVFKKIIIDVLLWPLSYRSSCCTLFICNFHTIIVTEQLLFLYLTSPLRIRFHFYVRFEIGILKNFSISLRMLTFKKKRVQSNQIITMCLSVNSSIAF